ncbi:MULTISPECIES: hypothetical protein [unclassified Thiocapsa]|uniref:hypothetical protein n=1 Tax=unclassified Thiocapsa TaxID=2641286 RepID=UPI0035B228FE
MPERPAERLARAGANVFSVEMLSETVTSEQELDALCPRPCALFVEPPSINDGIVNQFAFLSVTLAPKGTMEHWLAEHPGLARKIVIPAGLEWEIRDKLDQYNVTERVLFPGLEGLTAWLKRHYSPKEADRAPKRGSRRSGIDVSRGLSD